MDGRYRVVLTGELLAGHELEPSVHSLAALLRQPPEKVRPVFGRRATPLNKSLDYRGARDIEQRLRAIGVGCKVEALEQLAPAAFEVREPTAASVASTAAATTITCPKCGKAQPRAAECSGCGIVFAKYQAGHANPDPAPPAALSVAKDPAPAAPSPDLEELLGLYVGPRAERYLARFAPMRESGRYAPGWNWAAFFFSTAWVAYRKMWPWIPVALGITLLSVVVPWLGLLLHVGFTVSADYLYFRQVTAKVEALAVEPEAEAGIALAGGTHWAAALGVVVATALAVGLAVKSMMPLSMEAMLEVRETVASDPQIRELGASPEGVATQVAFQTAAIATHTWRHDGDHDLAEVSTERLIQDAAATQEQLTDGWGHRLALRPDAEGFLVISAGPDGAMDSDDDIPILFSAR